MTVKIQLTKGFVAIVDDEDADLAEYKWFASVRKRGRCVYAMRRYLENGKEVTTYIHLDIFQRIHGEKPSRGLVVDHKDTDSLNNRRENLRLASHAMNHANVSLYRNSTSGFKGVSWREKRKKWRATIVVEGKHKELGFFENKEDAADAYRKAAKKYFGEFARFE